MSAHRRLLAAYNGHLPVVRLLLEAGADLHAATNDGETAVYAAALNGHLPVVQHLLESGAELQSMSHFASQTPYGDLSQVSR